MRVSKDPADYVKEPRIKPPKSGVPRSARLFLIAALVLPVLAWLVFWVASRG